MLDIRFRICKASFNDRTYECWYAIVDASIQTMSNEKNDEGTILAQVMKFLFEKNNFRSTWLWPEFGVQFLDDSWLQRIFSESGSSYASMISRKMGLILKYKWNHCKHNQTKSLKNTGNVDVNPLTLKQRWRNIESSVDLLLLEPLFQRWNRHRLMHLSNFLDMIFLYHWLYFWRLQSARSEFLRGLGIPMPTQVRSRCIQLKLLSLFHWMGTKFRQF